MLLRLWLKRETKSQWHKTCSCVATVWNTSQPCKHPCWPFSLLGRFACGQFVCRALGAAAACKPQAWMLSKQTPCIDLCSVLCPICIAAALYHAKKAGSHSQITKASQHVWMKLAWAPRTLVWWQHATNICLIVAVSGSVRVQVETKANSQQLTRKCFKALSSLSTDPWTAPPAHSTWWHYQPALSWTPGSCWASKHPHLQAPVKASWCHKMASFGI